MNIKILIKITHNKKMYSVNITVAEYPIKYKEWFIVTIFIYLKKRTIRFSMHLDLRLMTFIIFFTIKSLEECRLPRQ